MVAGPTKAQLYSSCINSCQKGGRFGRKSISSQVGGGKKLCSCWRILNPKRFKLCPGDVELFQSLLQSLLDLFLWLTGSGSLRLQWCHSRLRGFQCLAGSAPSALRPSSSKPQDGYGLRVIQHQGDGQVQPVAKDPGSSGCGGPSHGFRAYKPADACLSWAFQEPRVNLINLNAAISSFLAQTLPT